MDNKCHKCKMKDVCAEIEKELKRCEEKTVGRWLTFRKTGIVKSRRVNFSTKAFEKS